MKRRSVSVNRQDRRQNQAGRPKHRWIKKEIMMIRKFEITRSQFTALFVAIILMSLIIYGWSGLVQSSELVLMILIVVAYAGIFPFILGIAIQTAFRKKTIPSYLAWILAFVVVAVQWICTRKTTVRVLEQDMISLIVSFLMLGVFTSLGISSCRAFMEGRKSKPTIG
jgi:hypothetical protein